ncbi:MAG: hypothetical protein ISR65_08015 [Bacteriovoracaceae bacterium]|nr:hypothetical protein [Bacteriovoracaceae bacterium]
MYLLQTNALCELEFDRTSFELITAAIFYDKQAKRLRHFSFCTNQQGSLYFDKKKSEFSSFWIKNNRHIKLRVTRGSGHEL